mgnify:CR=1 FL=1
MMNFELPLIIEDEEYNQQSQDELSHWHNSFELIEVVEGKFYCSVDGSQFLISQGDICIINRNKMHHIHNEKKISNVENVQLSSIQIITSKTNTSMRNIFVHY